MVDLLFYGAADGVGDFYSVGRRGGVHLLRHGDGSWRHTWNKIVKGRFGHDSPNSDLLFYDAEAGDGSFYSVDENAKIHPIRRGDGTWRHTWDMIVAGGFGGPGLGTDLLFYDRAAGDGSFYSVHDTGQLHPIRRGDGTWRHTWDMIVAGISAEATATPTYCSTTPPPATEVSTPRMGPEDSAQSVVGTGLGAVPGT